MGLFSIFRKKREFFTAVEKARIVTAIQASEKTTSGEVRVYIESKNPMVEPLDRASEIFFSLNMQNTLHRNAVLVYVAIDSHELALFADEGIYNEVGKAFWDNAVKEMLYEFRKDHLCAGIETCVRTVGATLTEKFPYKPAEDKNELPDDIVFGK